MGSTAPTSFASKTVTVRVRRLGHLVIFILVFKKRFKVIINKYSGTEVKYEGEEYIILREDDILAIIKAMRDMVVHEGNYWELQFIDEAGHGFYK